MPVQNKFNSFFILYTKILFRIQELKSRRKWNSIFMSALDGRYIFASQNVIEEMVIETER